MSNEISKYNMIIIIDYVKETYFSPFAGLLLFPLSFTKNPLSIEKP